MAVVCPAQNSGQVAGSAVAGSQVLTYGLRTASGAAGGRIGVAASVPFAAAYPADGVAAAWLVGPVWAARVVAAPAAPAAAGLSSPAPARPPAAAALPE
jgi:hypothetical protein